MKTARTEIGNVAAPLCAVILFVLVVASCAPAPHGARTDTAAGGNGVSSGFRTAEDSSDIEDAPDAEDHLEVGASLPDDFPVPVPDDYRVVAAGSVRNESSVVLEAPSGEEAYAYYRKVLAEEGFTVVDGGRNRSSYFHAELAVARSGFEGNLEFHEDRVEVDIDYYE